MPSSNFKLVIFDCDGTLVDSEYINLATTAEVLMSLGFTKFTPEYCLEHFSGCSLIDLENLLQELKISNPEEVLITMRNLAIATAHSKLQLIPGAKEVVSQLSLPKCIASNGERAAVLTYLKITNLLPYFPVEHIFTREMVTYPKPAPDLYLHAARTMQILPEDCLVIEDSPVGVAAGYAAGMTVVGYVNPHYPDKLVHKLKEAGAKYITRSFIEVLSILKPNFE